ncbi:MAG: hypothetical protein ABGX00_13320 [Allomuricauda sp.]
MGRGIYKTITYKVLDYDQLNDDQIYRQLEALQFKLRGIDHQNPGIFGLNILKEVMIEMDEIIKVSIRRHGNADAVYEAFNKPVFNFYSN